ncbi:MAG: hypothetical protein PVH00_01350 [Gemmatimonadota bacterium]
MSDPRPDADLRDRFQQLRSEDRAVAPEYAAMMERVRADLGEGVTAVGPDRRERVRSRWWRRHPRWLVAGGTLAAAAALATFLLFNPEARADRAFERTVETFTTATGGWRSPTDRLLDLPGSELMRSVPRVGNPTWPGSGTGGARRTRS